MSLNKCIARLLAIFLLGLYLPGHASCADPRMVVKIDEMSITSHEPRVMFTEKKEIPKVTVEQRSFRKYLWIGLGALLVAGGTAAALASGGSSGGDDGGGNDNSGDFSAEW